MRNSGRALLSAKGAEPYVDPMVCIGNPPTAA